MPSPWWSCSLWPCWRVESKLLRSILSVSAGTDCHKHSTLLPHLVANFTLWNVPLIKTCLPITEWEELWVQCRLIEKKDKKAVKRMISFTSCQKQTTKNHTKINLYVLIMCSSKAVVPKLGGVELFWDCQQREINFNIWGGKKQY